MKKFASFAIFLSVVSTVTASLIPSPVKRVDGPVTTLADGTGMFFGTTSNGLKWQASGILKQGCTDSAAHPIHIDDCYSSQLSDDPNAMLDQGHLDSPRQRNEFLTTKSADGTSVAYSWKYYLSSQVGTSTHFFHLMQVFSDGQGEPVVTLDAVNGQLAIVDVARGCTTNKCPAVAISQFTDRTTLHTIKVTFGPNGKLNYAVTNADTGASILSYSATGAMGSGGSYVKFGTYRATFAGMTAVNAVVGDFKSG